MAPLFLIKLVTSFIAKAAWILAIHLIRAGILELHHCLAVDIPPAEGRNWGEESDFYLRFHFSNSHESVWAGCTKPPSVSIQVYSSILQVITLHCLLHSLQPLSCKKIYLLITLCGAVSKQGHTLQARWQTDGLCALGRWARVTESGANTCIEQEGSAFVLAVYTQLKQDVF